MSAVEAMQLQSMSFPSHFHHTGAPQSRCRSSHRYQLHGRSRCAHRVQVVPSAVECALEDKVVFVFNLSDFFVPHLLPFVLTALKLQIAFDPNCYQIYHGLPCPSFLYSSRTLLSSLGTLKFLSFSSAFSSYLE